ncbi:MAG: hypothetical protein ACHQ53_15635, partial [Polyangiales bacterium]
MHRNAWWQRGAWLAVCLAWAGCSSTNGNHGSGGQGGGNLAPTGASVPGASNGGSPTGSAMTVSSGGGTGAMLGGSMTNGGAGSSSGPSGGSPSGNGGSAGGTSTGTGGSTGTTGGSDLHAVLLVGNSVSGSVSVLDAQTFANLGSVNVIPDLQDRLNEINGNPLTAVTYNA